MKHKITSERDAAIASAKTIAAILVVIGHSVFFSVETNVAGLGFDASKYIVDTTMIKHIFEIIVGIIYSCHMALFMVLSGMVYYIGDQKKYSDLHAFIRKKFKRLCVTYFAVSILYCIPTAAMCGYFGNPIEVEKVLYYMIGYGKNHLWFLVALFYIYCIVRLTRNNSFLYAALCICSVVMYIIVNSLYITELFYIDRLMMYLVWFLVGIELQKRIKTIHNQIKRRPAIWAVSMLCFWACFYVLGKMYPNLVVSTITTFTGVCFFIVISTIISPYDASLNKNRIFRRISSSTFEIYLFGTPANYIVFFVISIFYDCTHPLVLGNGSSLLLILFRVCFQIVFSLSVILLLEKIKQTFSKVTAQ